MKRWVWFTICAILGLMMLVFGLLMPVHLRAVDESIIQTAGRKTPSLIERGLALVGEQKLGAAHLLLKAAQAEELPDRDKLGLAVGNFAMQHPRSLVWGGLEPRLEKIFGNDTNLIESGSEPFAEFMVRRENRAMVLALLGGSPLPLVQELLRCRALTNTVLFSPSQSASGQAFDTALAIGGLLVEEGHLTSGLRNGLGALVAEAHLGGQPQRFEQALLDLMSLGQRFNWGQLTAFVGRVEDVETLRLLAQQVRQAEDRLPVLFTVVQVSGRPASVAAYLIEFSQTGLKDLTRGLHFGAGGVNELLGRQQRLCSSWWRQRLAGYDPFGAFFYFVLDYCWLMPWFALAAKWLFYLSGGYFIATALHFARPAVSVLEQPLQVRGFHVAREVLFALGFLLVVLLLSEPFLSQESQRVEFPFRLRLPTVGGAVPAESPRAHSSLMNQLSLLTLLLFFVLQALLYTASLVKLAEIRRQHASARLKLKLLENEDHLFDAGLYLGFAGTIVSLILVSLGVIQPSLMAAYSSTSFGIIFVSVFKIFHLRPLRRQFLLEAEAGPSEPEAPVAANPFAKPS